METPCPQNTDDRAENGGVASLLRHLKDRHRLDDAGVAFRLGVDVRTVSRWRVGSDTTRAKVSLRLLSALLKSCPEAAHAAWVYDDEEWGDLVSGLRPTQKAAWSQVGNAGVVRDGADDAAQSAAGESRRRVTR